jgi:hypothetical protein
MEDKKPFVPGIVSLSIGIIMVVLYITLGTTIIFKASSIPSSQPLYTQLFGIVLVGYGIFRGFKVYTKYSRSQP